MVPVAFIFSTPGDKRAFSLEFTCWDSYRPVGLSVVIMLNQLKRDAVSHVVHVAFHHFITVIIDFWLLANILACEYPEFKKEIDQINETICIL